MVYALNSIAHELCARNFLCMAFVKAWQSLLFLELKSSNSGAEKYILLDKFRENWWNSASKLQSIFILLLQLFTSKSCLNIKSPKNIPQAFFLLAHFLTLAH